MLRVRNCSYNYGTKVFIKHSLCIFHRSSPPVSLALLSPSRYGPSILPAPALPTSQFLHHHSQVSSLVNSLPHHHPHHPHHAMHGLANGLSLGLNGVSVASHNASAAAAAAAAIVSANSNNNNNNNSPLVSNNNLSSTENLNATQSSNHSNTSEQHSPSGAGSPVHQNSNGGCPNSASGGGGGGAGQENSSVKQHTHSTSSCGSASPILQEDTGNDNDGKQNSIRVMEVLCQLGTGCKGFP